MKPPHTTCIYPHRPISRPYIHIYAHTYVRGHRYPYIFIYMYVHIYICCICMCIYIYIFMYVCFSPSLFIYTRIISTGARLQSGAGSTGGWQGARGPQALGSCQGAPAPPTGPQQLQLLWSGILISAILSYAANTPQDDEEHVGSPRPMVCGQFVVVFEYFGML